MPGKTLIPGNEERDKQKDLQIPLRSYLKSEARIGPVPSDYCLSR